MAHTTDIITSAYSEYRPALQRYVAMRINDSEEAADIVQDVFVRLLGYDLVAPETVRSLCYTIANNLVVDRLRRHYKRQDVLAVACAREQKRTALTPEQVMAFHELAEKERCIMLQLSPATRKVYEMTQYDGCTIDEISAQLGISHRTVECHQYRARKYIREEMRKII